MNVRMVLGKNASELNRNLIFVSLFYFLLALGWSLAIGRLVGINGDIISSNLISFLIFLVVPISYLLYLDYKNRPRTILTNILIAYLVILSLFQVVIYGQVFLRLLFMKIYHPVILVPFLIFAYWLYLLYYIKNRKTGIKSS